MKKSYLNVNLFFGILIGFTILSSCTKSISTANNTGSKLVLLNFKNVKQATLEEIMADAQTQNKVIFIDFYTTWCGPCKWMDENVFAKNDVAATFNKHFINYKVDAEDFEGVNTAIKYNVGAYPTLVFIKPNGEVLYRVEGMIPHESFMQIVDEVLTMK